jgi:hypothetical protein
MSKIQFRALAVCCWLVAVCCAIATLAMYETYTMFRDGPRVTATVVEVRGGNTLEIEYVAPGEDEPTTSWVKAGEKLAAGARVDVHLHDRNYQPILASRLSTERPSLLLPLGFVLAVVLGILLWVAPRRAAARRAARTSPLDAIVDAAARTRNVSLGTGIFMVLAGAGMAVVPFFDTESSIGLSVGVWVIAALSVGFGAFVLRRAYLLRDPRNNEIVDLIERRPQEIAWYYVTEITTNNIKASATLVLEIWLTTGKLVSVSLVREDVDAVMGELARRAPDAKAGFDAELRRQYRAQQRARRAA